MDRLETLIRDALVEHAGEAPSGPVPLERPAARPRTAWVAAVAAAAAVVAIAIVLAVVATSGPQRHASAPGHDSLRLPRDAELPPGSRLASFGPVSVQVPAGLPTRTSLCGRSVANEVVVATTHDELCPDVAHGVARHPGTVVWFSTGRFANPYRTIATGPARVDGRSVRRGYAADFPRPGDGVSAVLALPHDRVVLGVTAPTRAAVDRLLGSVRIAAVDPFGCAARFSAAARTAPGSADALVPTHAVEALRCEYNTRSPAPRILLGSYRLGPADAVRISSALNRLRPDPCQCAHGGTATPGEDEVLYFRYRDRPSVRVTGVVGANLDSWSDGPRTVANFDSSVARLLGRLTHQS